MSRLAEFSSDCTTYISLLDMNRERSMDKNEKIERFLKYSPGSPDAVALGCTCPQALNNFGRGRSTTGVIEPNFAADPDCPVHAFEIISGLIAD
jgi:hypothetical protein